MIAIGPNEARVSFRLDSPLLGRKGGEADGPSPRIKRPRSGIHFACVPKASGSPSLLMADAVWRDRQDLRGSGWVALWTKADSVTRFDE